ncbi:hypothetical protein Mapa_013233 [Marchantia paleacea]|nr:hypothetical protein Mapa_013233 [Marchantia paleacea]
MDTATGTNHKKSIYTQMRPRSPWPRCPRTRTRIWVPKVDDGDQNLRFPAQRRRHSRSPKSIGLNSHVNQRLSSCCPHAASSSLRFELWTQLPTPQRFEQQKPKAELEVGRKQ